MAMRLTEDGTQSGRPLDTKDEADSEEGMYQTAGKGNSDVTSHVKKDRIHDKRPKLPSMGTEIIIVPSTGVHGVSKDK